ncbi:MAG TPA: Smr/MutS family protein [Caulobacteraceae bacterium]
MRLKDDDIRDWAIVAATVRPLPGRAPPAPAPPAPPPGRLSRAALQASPVRRRAEPAPSIIEPGRYRRMALGREAIGGRLDLHGLNQDQARADLITFLRAAVTRGARGVLVITGKGALGDGVLRRRVPEWLAEPPLRPLVAGISEAHRRHGGAGALYVALKRRRS